MSTSRNRREVRLFVEFVGFGSDVSHDVMDGTKADGVVEDIAKKGLDATKRGMAVEQKSEHKLANESFGDREIKQDFLVSIRVLFVGLFESFVSSLGVLVKEFSADAVLSGKLTDIAVF